MDEKIQGKVTLPPAVQVGMVVKDVEKVMHFYSSAFGIGPWLTTEGETESRTPDGAVFKYRIKAAFARLGPAQLELFQVTEGRSPVHSDWLDRGYEGIHHLGFFVGQEERNRYPGELARLGIEVYQERQANVFMNTAKVGGVFFEFIDAPGGMPEAPPGPVVEGKVGLPSNLQLGLVVRDVDRVTDFYSSAFGIGPWQKRRGGGPETVIDGKAYDFKTHVAFAELGGVQLEVFTITEGTSPVHALFLDQGREGGHHFGFFVGEEQRGRIKEAMAELGVGIFQEGAVAGRGKYVFFDTRNQGGPFFEFIAPIVG